MQLASVHRGRPKVAVRTVDVDVGALRGTGANLLDSLLMTSSLLILGDDLVANLEFSGGDHDVSP